jgi:hypothetical protein
MEFIVLMDRIKCRYNTPLQVLKAAPALDSFIIIGRDDVAYILEFMKHKQFDLRKLILVQCSLGESSTSILGNIEALLPDLEVLECYRSWEGSRPITCDDSHCVIPSLKKPSELTLSYSKVHYVCVNLLETHVCIYESMWENTPRNTFYILREEDLLHF